MGKIATKMYTTLFLLAPAGMLVCLLLSTLHQGFVIPAFVWFAWIAFRLNRMRCPNCGSKIENWTRKKIGSREIDWWSFCPPKCHKCGQKF